MRKWFTDRTRGDARAGFIPEAVDRSETPGLPPEGNDWENRRLKAEMCLVPWIEQHFPLAGRTVFEYGCGNGPVSCAFAGHVRSHVGLDIDRDQIELGRRRVSDLRLNNVDLVHTPVEEAFDEMARLAAGVDVVLFYAVLEHMTIAERFRVLKLAREVVHPEGVIVVCELPNRLIPYDGHTSQMPFFDQLPNELAVDYYRFSQREDFVTAMDSARACGPDDAMETLARWGRGMSFHEFELVFGDLRRHVLASNYDELVMPVRSVSGEELALAQLIDGYRADLAPVWSRYWQDVIFSAAPLGAVPHFIRPLPLDRATGEGTACLGWGVVEMSTGAMLQLSLPVPSKRFLVGVIADVEEITVEVVAPDGRAALRVPAWRSHAEARYATLELAAAASEVEIRLSSPGRVVFVGYEA